MTAQGPDRPSGDSHDAEEIRFGVFQFFPARSVLMKDGKRVRIGSRALALLNALVENAGQFVANDVLMAKAWPSTSVEETNLRVQMTILRRLLDDTTREQSHITNAPGRGYAFTSPLARLQQDKVSSTPDPEALHNLPIPLTPLIGRRDVIAAIVDRLGTRRLISVVGPGGIGKTCVATEVSWRIADERGLRVCFVDLAPLASADFVTGAVAAALHLDYSETASPLDQIIKLLRQSEFLLVLDNCEHVVDEGAALAETLLRGVPKLRILATSREPLRAEGEITVRLAGLDAPQATAEIADLRSASQYPAVELFVERAVAGGDDISLLDADAPLISQICRQLDGIPLAIELAAARIGFLGIAGIAKHLESRFELLAEGRRTALPRHRTMWAALNWSFEGLSENEQMLLTRLCGLPIGLFDRRRASRRIVSIRDRNRVAVQLGRQVAGGSRSVRHGGPLSFARDDAGICRGEAARQRRCCDGLAAARRIPPATLLTGRSQRSGAAEAASWSLSAARR